MAILNVTPDSFSDGGLFTDRDAAVGTGLQMVAEGADLVDVGGESTRPGAEPVSLEEELRRVVPVIRSLAEKGVRVSVDTTKAEVARAALDAGAVMVNDVTAFGDPEMPGVCARRGCSVCLMHMQGTPRTMQQKPVYEDVVREVRDSLLEAVRTAESAGIARDAIWIDPGIGFGKNLEHNLSLIGDVRSLVDTGFPVLLGVSRKSFISRALGGLEIGDRLEGTLASQVIGQMQGVAMIRAHDVRAARRTIDLVAQIQAASS